MNRNTTPNPPDDLLARCLATIPQAAAAKTTAPRLFPDAGSRKRLAWLTVAAAIPVMTVLAVLPVKLWNESKSVEQSRAGSVMPKRIIPFCSALTVSRQPDLNATRAEDWYTDRVMVVQQVWHINKGRYTIGGWVNGDPNLLAGEFQWTDDAALELPNGTIYQRLANGVHTGKKTPDYFRRAIDGEMRNLLDPERCTETLTGYGHYEKSSQTHKHPAAAVEKRVVGDFLGTEGQPRKVEVVVYVQRPCADLLKRGAPTKQVRYYRDLKTGLCYAYEAFAVWETGKRKGKAPLLIQRAQYRYDARSDSLSLFDPSRFKNRVGDIKRP